MIAQNKILAIIPARGGSKRLPRKNVLDLFGIPLIAWTINAAKKSKYIDRVIVSTDDHEITDIAKAYGAEVPFRRPDDLSDDTSSSIDVVVHALNTLKKEQQYYDYVILLQPTSPLRTEEDIDSALVQLIERQEDAVISICEADHSPLWMNTLGKNQSMEGFISHDVVNKRSQDLDKYYRLNGAIYIVSVKRLLEMKQPTFFLQDRISGYVMPRERSIDIDSDIDFEIAKVLKRLY